MRCEKGYCIVCDKEIMTKCSGCDSRKANDQYTEVLIPWSNGSRMTMACCVECSKSAIWKSDKTLMTRAVWDAWDKAGQTYSKEVVIVD